MYSFSLLDIVCVEKVYNKKTDGFTSAFMLKPEAVGSAVIVDCTDCYLI